MLCPSQSLCLRTQLAAERMQVLRKRDPDFRRRAGGAASHRARLRELRHGIVVPPESRCRNRFLHQQREHERRAEDRRYCPHCVRALPRKYLVPHAYLVPNTDERKGFPTSLWKTQSTHRARNIRLHGHGPSKSSAGRSTRIGTAAVGKRARCAGATVACRTSAALGIARRGGKMLWRGSECPKRLPPTGCA